jgi:hypothetical protein
VRGTDGGITAAKGGALGHFYSHEEAKMAAWIAIALGVALLHWADRVRT